MFLDANGKFVGDGDDKFRKDAEGFSKFVLAGMQRVQLSRPPQIFDGQITTHCVLAGAAFAVGVLIKDLPQRDRKRLIEYFNNKLAIVLKEHGA